MSKGLLFRKRARHVPTLKVYGPDRRGLVAASSEWLHRHGFAIVQSEQFTDFTSMAPRAQPMFFQRILFEDAVSKHGSPTNHRLLANQLEEDADNAVNTFWDDREAEMECEVAAMARELGVTMEVDWMRKPKRVAIMVSKFDHCLWELLLRHQANDLMNAEIPIVISNHETCRPIAEETFGILFHCFPITPFTKIEQEQNELELLRQHRVDVVVLARYMQVLSTTFLGEYKDRIINIHHSFLPAFGGGRAYQRAHERGVKLIGATVSF